MFNYYLPDPINERLPMIYLGLASALAVAPLAPIKWVSVAALLLAMMVTKHQRQVSRAAVRVRAVAPTIPKSCPCVNGTLEIPTYSDDFDYRVRSKAHRGSEKARRSGMSARVAAAAKRCQAYV